MNTFSPRWMAALWIAIAIAACGDADVNVPEPMQHPTPVIPGPDQIAICDGADDGTPCGTAGEMGRHMHCVFGLCARNLCGDTVIADNEQCDDGNDRVGDGCDARCLIEVGGVCGNGTPENTEECDDGNRINDDVCANACTLNVCRNGRLDPGEECDDGNRVHFDARHDGNMDDGSMGDDVCSNACMSTVCGNGRIDPGEECDDDNAVADDACSNACSENVCGNQRVDPGEVCDGDVLDGLACNNECSGRAVDQCVLCMEANCGATYEIDLFNNCRVAVDPVQLPSPPTRFVEKCTALDECERRNRCSDDVLGTVPCYCGAGVDPALCQAGTQVEGPCTAEAADATGCPLNDSNCIMSLFQDLTLPSGYASFLAQCRYTLCVEACGL